jgi:hypothetical protein
MTLKEKREVNKRRDVLINEVYDLLLERAHLTRKDLLREIIAGFAAGNLDLLTPEELKKYKSAILESSRNEKRRIKEKMAGVKKATSAAVSVPVFEGASQHNVAH